MKIVLCLVFLCHIMYTNAQAYKNPYIDEHRKQDIQDKHRDRAESRQSQDGSNPWLAYERYKEVYDNKKNPPLGSGVGRTAGSRAYQGYQDNRDEHDHYKSVDDQWFIDTYSNDNPRDPKNQYYQHGDHYHQYENTDGRTYHKPYGTGKYGSGTGKYGSGTGKYGSGTYGSNTGSRYTGNKNTHYNSDPGSASYQKDGWCPMVSEKLNGNCRKACDSDKDCPGYNICCVNNCGGTACVTPLKEDPCLDFRCPLPGQVCLNEGTHAWCACETQCSNSYEPVCGSDGNQYNNKCYMDLYACRNKKVIDEIACRTVDVANARQHQYRYYSSATTHGGAVLVLGLTLAVSLVSIF